MKTLNLHLVSDSTGETVRLVAKACLVQFENITVNELDWTMIRTAHQMEKVIKGIEAERGFVLYTLVNPPLRQALEDGCRKLQIPCIPVLDPVVAALGGYLGCGDHRGRYIALCDRLSDDAARSVLCGVSLESRR